MSKNVTFNTEDVKVYLAAAGSGKTSALMREMTSLLDVYRPNEIAFVTFTRKGVAHGVEQALFANPGLAAEDLVYFRTLHSLCFKALGLKPKSMITPANMRVFNNLLGFKVTLHGSFDKQTDDDKLMARYDAIRSGSKKGALIYGVFNEERYTRLVKAYEAFKRINHLIDFYDCLSMFRDKNEPLPVKAAFIDEAQDLTHLQWDVCQIAFSRAEKIRISGDDYQALFSYGGASPRTLVAMTDRYETIKLEKSYRLPRAVYRFARGIVDVIDDKIEKDFTPVKDVEGFVEETSDRHRLARKIRRDLEKNGFLPYRWFLLFRTNCFITEAAEILETFCIPYHTAKGFCLDERMLHRIKRYVSFQKRGYGTKEAFERFCEMYGIKDINEDFTESELVPDTRRYVYFDYVQKYGIDWLLEAAVKEPTVMLSTTYKVKGGEADYVAAFLDCTKRVHENMLFNIDEELRVLYVACTRARLGLYLVQSAGKYGLDRVVEAVKEKIA
jgi:superfamily I DNA/RNA helicase